MSSSSYFHIDPQIYTPWALSRFFYPPRNVSVKIPRGIVLWLFSFGIFTPLILTVEQCVHGCVLKTCKLFSDIWSPFALSPFTASHKKARRQTNLRCIRSTCDLSWLELALLFMQTFTCDLNLVASHRNVASFCAWNKAALSCRFYLLD